MKKIVAMVVVAACASVMLAGCGKIDATKNTLALKSDGSVTEISIEDFNESYYNEGELQNYITAAVGDYNTAAGDEVVEVVESVVEVPEEGSSLAEGKIAKLTVEYASADIYSDFSGTDCFAGTIDEAKAAGYPLDGAIAEVVDGQTTSNVIPFASLSGEEYSVFIAKTDSNIVVPGTILYVSTNGTKVIDKKNVEVATRESDTAAVNYVYVIYKPAKFFGLF